MLHKSRILLSATLAVVVMSLSPASAQQRTYTVIDTKPGATIAQLKAAGGSQELKCSGPSGHVTCTSKYAFVCPAGWSACSASPGGTCCTQN